MADSGDEPTPYRQEKFFFKRMAWGWVFRSPISWWPFGLGPRRYYLLNEAQKAQTARGVAPPRAIAGCLAPRFCIPSVVVWKAARPWVLELSPLALSLLFGLWAGLWAQIVFNLFYWQALRPILADAPRTDNRISFAELARASADTQSVATWIFGGLVAAATSGFGVYDWLVSEPRIVGPAQRSWADWRLPSVSQWSGSRSGPSD
jgi:hypothetical protein